jgi:hypothetical protein
MAPQLRAQAVAESTLGTNNVIIIYIFDYYFAIFRYFRKMSSFWLFRLFLCGAIGGGFEKRGKVRKRK